MFVRESACSVEKARQQRISLCILVLFSSFLSVPWPEAMWKDQVGTGASLARVVSSPCATFGVLPFSRWLELRNGCSTSALGASAASLVMPFELILIFLISALPSRGG